MRIELQTLRTAARDGWANRGSFLLQVTFMIANDIVWIIFWALFFGRVGTVRGWTLHDVLLLFATITVAAGLAFGVFANCRRIGQMAGQGELDETLILPVPPLRHILFKRINASNIGDMVFGLALFAVAGDPTPERTALFIAGCLLGTVVLVSFIVLVGSLSFFTGGEGQQADAAFNAVILFASYPVDFFGGAVKVLLYTAVPAAFVTGLPVALVRHFDPVLAVGLVSFCAAIAGLATSVFTLGLRRYSSGSLWVR
jgi:viologen exporter family transport system permease protein